MAAGFPDLMTLIGVWMWSNPDAGEPPATPVAFKGYVPVQRRHVMRPVIQTS